MQIILTVLLIAAVTASVGGVLVYYYRLELMAMVLRMLWPIDEPYVPEDIEDSEIQSMVEALFAEEEDDFNIRRLKVIARRAAPFLIEALQDPRAATFFSQTQHAMSAASPFERICNVLEEAPPRSAVAPLVPYLKHSNDHFRKHAALLLGNIGTTECIDPVLTALDDDDDYVRSYAMMGIEQGIEAECCEHIFLEAVFPALMKLLDRSGQSVRGTAPLLLLAIDADKAVPILLSQQYFTIENSELHYIIRALNRDDVPIPHDKLLPLLEQLEPVADQYPHYYEFAQALLAYARNPDAQAEGIFRRHLDSPDEQIQAAAADALAILSGVGDHGTVVWALLEEHGFEALPLALKHYIAVHFYDSQVNNGGHSQFFVNPSGRYYKFALDGLQAMGASERATILQEAVARLGPGELPEREAPRQDRLTRLFRQNNEVFDDLDARYYDCTENVSQLLGLYAVEHKADFVEPEL